MKYAVIKKGTVENVILCDSAEMASENGWVEADEHAEIGGTYADGVFTRKPQPEQQTIPYDIARRSAYKAEADDLFFQEQRGEVPAGSWEDKVSEIKQRFPKN